MPMTSQPLNILVLHVGGLTETTLGLPALRSLREHFRSSRITIATSSAAAELVRLGECADEILPVARLRAEILSPGLFYRSFRAVQALRAATYDLAIELHRSREASFILPMVKAHKRLLVSDAGHQNRLLQTVAQTVAQTVGRLAGGLGGQARQPEHLAQQFLRRLEPLGVRPIESEPRLITDKDSDARMEKWLEKNGVNFGELLVGIHPGAGATIERWPFERFTSVATRLIHNFNARVIVLGGASERGLAKRIVKTLPPKRALTLQSPGLSDFVSLLARLSVLVGNHSGPAHIAAAIRTPVVVASALLESSEVNLLSANHIPIRHTSAAMIQEEDIYEAACRLIKSNRAHSLWDS